MSNFISEDDIEQAILQKLEAEPFRYDIVHCDPSPDKREVLPDGTGRTDKKKCVLPLVLREALSRLNPAIRRRSWMRLQKTCAAIFPAPIWWRPTTSITI